MSEFLGLFDGGYNETGTGAYFARMPVSYPNVPRRCVPCQVRWVGNDPCWMCGGVRSAAEPLKGKRWTS